MERKFSVRVSQREPASVDMWESIYEHYMYGADAMRVALDAARSFVDDTYGDERIEHPFRVQVYTEQGLLAKLELD